ncbi:LacI family DNA-binding transcriptional regulator [Labrenzia sp. VG12]|uniref:LacI family DNA-binding transcriptional regulator n=1 Tax=Labrenzia sp. VG12 TaxID=2021862 RepID=UPI000B8C1EF5|nr:LacI family DNA-binding transcriptional regulator [Labrenzia sp. VG12]ASP35889.1 LacI family transcriptional regulator [Labrenzia sp. VG12]
MTKIDENNQPTVTADDVAEAAGVSRWTVNRAFKKDASISNKAREKVINAANALGYVPDLLASSLASDRSNLVALLVDDFANPHKLVMLERLTRALRKNGWDSLLVNTLDPDDTSAALLTASQRRVDAAVLIGSGFDDKALETALGARRVKKLVVFARISENPNTVSICCDDRAAMSEIADHVIGQGYRRPLFVAGPQLQSAHLMRKETFLNCWEIARGARPDVISPNSYDPELAYQSVTDHFRSLPVSDRPDILVCENDAIAIGAYDALRHEFGVSIPQEIAITGFDDVPQAASPHYNITTYRQPISAMAEGLISILKGTDTEHDLSKFTGKLVVRGSA